MLAGLETLNGLGGKSAPIASQIQKAMPPLKADLDALYPMNDIMVREFTNFFIDGKTLECIRRYPHPFNDWLPVESSSFWLSFFCESVSVNTDYLGPQKADEKRISAMIKQLRDKIPSVRAQKIKSLRQSIGEK